MFDYMLMIGWLVGDWMIWEEIYFSVNSPSIPVSERLFS
jgi:hypothetical protein